MKYNYLKLFVFIIGFLFFIFSCSPETIDYPCESIICQNDGVCLHGNCLCEEEYVGDSCETPVLPASIMISDIYLSSYPIFIEDDPWDVGLPTPYCWPDLALLIQWPWNDNHQSFVMPNSEGQALTWNSGSFPYIKDNHIHYGDEILLSVLEIDGLDSLETVQVPETLKTFTIRTVEFVFVEADELWPSTTLYQFDSLGLELTVDWEYYFEH